MSLHSGGSLLFSFYILSFLHEIGCIHPLSLTWKPLNASASMTCHPPPDNRSVKGEIDTRSVTMLTSSQTTVSRRIQRMFMSSNLIHPVHSGMRSQNKAGILVIWSKLNMSQGAFNKNH